MIDQRKENSSLMRWQKSGARILLEAIFNPTCETIHRVSTRLVGSLHSHCNFCNVANLYVVFLVEGCRIIGTRLGPQFLLTKDLKVREVSCVCSYCKAYRRIVMTMKTSMGISLKNSVEKVFYN
jgi:hypothetical protein